MEAASRHRRKARSRNARPSSAITSSYRSRVAAGMLVGDQPMCGSFVTSIPSSSASALNRAYANGPACLCP